MSVTPYATLAEFATVYSYETFGISDGEVNSTWLPYGYLRVNEGFGGCFTLPFSSNNETAKDLNIHYAFLGILLRTRNQDDSDELEESLAGRVSDICSGNSAMILSDGAAYRPDIATKFEAWSNTQKYKNTFDMREAINQRIDPDLIDDTWTDDNS